MGCNTNINEWAIMTIVQDLIGKTNLFHIIIYKRYRQRERYHIIIRKFAQSIRTKNVSDIQQDKVCV
jgi:hypothetical protein